VAFGANVLRRHSPLRATTWAVLAGTLAMAPLALAQLRTWDPRLLTPEVPLALAYSALLAVAAANVVNFRAVQLLGPTRVTAYQFLTPAFAVLLAALLLGEGIRPEQVVGGLVIVLGILVMRRAPVRVRAVHGPGERADVPGPSSQGPA
jgi:drug/metabolite transporter (DMT)-like permease